MSHSEQARLRCVECRRELRTSAKNGLNAMRNHYTKEHPDSPRRDTHIDGDYGWTWVDMEKPLEQQTVLPLTEDGPWWTCKFDGMVSNDGPFCSICGRTRGWAELLRPDLIPSSAPMFVRPRIHVVVGQAGHAEIVRAPRFYRLRRWVTKYMR